MSLLEQYRLCCPSIMTTHICVCSEDYIALSLNERGTIAIWETKNSLEKPFTLIGHHKTVKSLSFSHQPVTRYLCSCSSDNIILWNLQHNNGKPTTGRVLHSNTEQPLHSQFSLDNSKIAISFTNGTWIFDLKENVWFASVERTRFTLFNYSINNDKLLGLEENQLKIWDLKTNEVATKVIIASGFPSAMCLHDQNTILAIGSTNGHLIVYSPDYCIIRNIQIWRLLRQYLQLDPNVEGPYTGSDSYPIYSLEMFSFNEFSRSEWSLLDEIYVLVVTSTCLFLLNLNNEEIIFFFNFNDNYEELEKEANIGLISSATTSLSSDKSIAFICLITVISETLLFLKLPLKETILSNNLITKQSTKNKDIEHESDSCKPYFTFLNSDCGSYGKSLLFPRSQTVSPRKSLKKTASKLNLPVTFHTNIKSSGYGIVRKPVTLFQPQINKVNRSMSQSSLPLIDLQNSCTAKKRNVFEHYEKPINCENLELLSKMESFENPTISSLHITANGQYASCTSSEGLIDILKLGKKNIKVSHTICAHKGEVNAAKWSHSGNLVVTAGKDKTAKVWNIEKSQPLLTIGMVKDTKDESKSKFTFKDAVEEAQFYYLDRFILTASGNEVHIFDYTINIEKSGMKNLINKSYVKLVKKIPMDMKRVTTIAAMNQFFSNLVLCSGTSKCIHIIDMAVGKVLGHIDDSSTRSPHLISLNEGSPYTTQVSSMYDVFLSAYLFDGIKVWDLRINKSVLCYKEHKCRSLPCGAAFSSCGKYIATGSEDKSVYIYDLRQLPAMRKLTDNQIDAFTSIAFSPRSQLIASSLNGLISLYGEIDGAT